MNSYPRIYAAVNRIPKGRVATYGQVARIAGLGRQPRQVGYALSALVDQKVAWHRVINAKGEISLRSVPGYEHRQRRLLEKEGIRFDRTGRVSLKKYQWKKEM